MKRMTVIVLALMLLAAAPVFAQEESGVVVQTSCSIVESGEQYLAYCFAQVHNGSDQVLCLDEGTFQLNGSDDAIASEEISQLWPYFLAPGGNGYLFDIVPFNELPQVTGIDYNIRYLTINPAYAGEALDASAHVEMDDVTGALSVACEIANPTSIDAYDPTVVVGLYTDAGQLVYADGRNLQDVGIAAGGKLLIRFEVEPTLVEQWMSYDAVPTQVNVSAMIRTGSD